MSNCASMHKADQSGEHVGKADCAEGDSHRRPLRVVIEFPPSAIGGEHLCARAEPHGGNAQKGQPDVVAQRGSADSRCGKGFEPGVEIGIDMEYLVVVAYQL